MMDLREIAWMRVQWKRFRRVLGGATGVVWLMCCSGIILLGDEEEVQWFWARMALLFMLVSSTGVSMWLFFTAWRELRRLGELATEARIEQMQSERAKKKRRRSRRPAAASSGPYPQTDAGLGAEPDPEPGPEPENSP